MHVLVIGAAGMIGRKLVARIAKEGGIGGRPVSRLTLVDVAAPAAPEGIPTEAWAADLSAPGEAEKMIAGRPELIYHLAAIVSARRRRISTRATASTSTARAAVRGDPAGGAARAPSAARGLHLLHRRPSARPSRRRSRTSST
jgi:nucleoside-diphosphate-sugar epimerase